MVRRRRPQRGTCRITKGADAGPDWWNRRCRRLFRGQFSLRTAAAHLWLAHHVVLNLPTGLLLVAMSPLLPESAWFLQQMGHDAEAHAMLARFGAVAHKVTSAAVASDAYSWLSAFCSG